MAESADFVSKCINAAAVKMSVGGIQGTSSGASDAEFIMNTPSAWWEPELTGR